MKNDNYSINHKIYIKKTINSSIQLLYFGKGEFFFPSQKKRGGGALIRNGALFRGNTALNFKSYDSLLLQLYLEEKEENDKLRKEVKKISQELSDTKQDLDKARQKQDSSRSVDSSADRRVYHSPYSSHHDYGVNDFNI